VAKTETATPFCALCYHPVEDHTDRGCRECRCQRQRLQKTDRLTSHDGVFGRPMVEDARPGAR
jgi:hypothetical protein